MAQPAWVLVTSKLLMQVSVRHLFVMHLPSALHLTQQAVSPQVAGSRWPSEHRSFMSGTGYGAKPLAREEQVSPFLSKLNTR